MSEPFDLVVAGPADVAALADLIARDGPNDWNWLPQAAVAQHLLDVEQGRAQAVLAYDSAVLVGAVTFCQTRQFFRHQSMDRVDAVHGYVCEAVVRHDRAGRGLGSRLLAMALQRLAAQGMREVYIDRHEENLASAGMMRKAGFDEVETYADPGRRPNGSGRTTICRVKTSPPGQ